MLSFHERIKGRWWGGWSSLTTVNIDECGGRPKLSWRDKQLSDRMGGKSNRGLRGRRKREDILYKSETCWWKDEITEERLRLR